METATDLIQLADTPCPRSDASHPFYRGHYFMHGRRYRHALFNPFRTKRNLTRLSISASRRGMGWGDIKLGNWRLASVLLIGAGGAMTFSGPAVARPCLTDAEIEKALGPAVRAGASILDTRILPDLPLCSGLTLAQRIQRMRAEAFPEEAARAQADRQAAIEQEHQYPREIVAPEFAENGLSADQPEPLHVLEPTRPRAPVVLRRKAAPMSTRNAPARRTYASAYYPNCRAARAAGAAPIRRGSPGYSARLDRDGDGIACE